MRQVVRSSAVEVFVRRSGVFFVGVDEVLRCSSMRIDRMGIVWLES